MTNLKEKGKIEVEIKNNREVSETKSWSFEKINKIDKLITILIIVKRRQITILGMRKGNLLQILQVLKEE